MLLALHDLIAVLFIHHGNVVIFVMLSKMGLLRLEVVVIINEYVRLVHMSFI